MSSPIITIGSYCADFTIADPLSDTGYTYYSHSTADGSIYYLVQKGTVKPNGTRTGADLDLTIIESPITLPANAALTQSGTTINDIFKEFRFRAEWFSPIGTSINGGVVTPSNMKRFLTSVDQTSYDSSRTTRMVVLETPDAFSPIFLDDRTLADYNYGSTDSTTIDSSLTTSLTSGTLKFIKNTTSPTIATRSQVLFYLVLKSDYDKRRTQEVTAQKQLRYLVATKSGSTVTFELRDLYDPDVTGDTIKKCAYRLSVNTNVEITGSGTSVSVTQTYGLNTYIDNTSIALSSTATGYPNANGATVSTSANENAYNPHISNLIGRTNSGTGPDNTRANGLKLSDFKDSSGNGATATFTNAIQSSSAFSQFAGYTVTFVEGFKYTDYSDPTNVQIVTLGASETIEFVFWQDIPDKTVEQLFTDVDVSLFKLTHVKSGWPAPATNVVPTSGGTATTKSTEYYLGFEFHDRTSEGSVTLSTGTYSNAQLIARDYFKFKEPARATQFKMYDLGKAGKEYLWQINLPANYNSSYAYVFDNNGSIQFKESITANERGWELEWEQGITPPGVRLKYAGTGRYLSTSTTDIAAGTGNFNNSADNKPFKLMYGTSNKADAAIFNCISCSRIDPATGACIPVTAGAYSPTNPPGNRPRRSPVYSPVGGSTTVPFKMVFATVTAPGGSFVGYSNAVVSGETSPIALAKFASPIPATSAELYQDTFVLTTVGRLSSDTKSAGAFFLKSANTNQYLRNIVSASGGGTTVEFISTTNPTEEDGFAWIFYRNTSITGTSHISGVYLVSIKGVERTNIVGGTGRYLQTGGLTIGTSTAAVTVSMFKGATAFTTPFQANDFVDTIKISTTLPA